MTQLYGGDFRQAVIDACTAAEMTLSKALKDSLTNAGVPEDTIARSLKEAAGIVAVFRLYVISGGRPGVSDGRVMNQLAEPRNNAAHRGELLDRQIAQRAIESAKALVGATDPLPTPSAAKKAAKLASGS
jgi:hypothetical protein